MTENNTSEKNNGNINPEETCNSYFYDVCSKIWIKHNWFWVLVYALVILFFLASFYYTSSSDYCWNDFTAALRFPLIVIFIVAFIQIYTDPIPLLPEEWSTDAAKKECEHKNRISEKWQRRKWMVFAYSFMLVAIGGAIYPFANPWPASGNDNDYFETLRERPIAVFIGCSINGGNKNLLLDCARKEPNKPQSDKPESASPDQPEKIKDKDKKNQQTTEQKIENSKQPENDSLPDQTKTNSSWILNIGGYIEQCTKDKHNNGNVYICQVSGGLVIPLYFIILALMGGSISLTRRLPEYQKQASPSYVATEKLPKFSQHEFREYLIFQIIQFISAPLIAVLAYYLVEPSNVTSSVVLAFSSGFASESILVMVRSLSEKITPDMGETVKTGTVTGVITFAEGAAKGKPIEKAKVALSESPNVHTFTDNAGHYVLSNVPSGEHGIKITYTVEEPKKDQSQIDSQKDPAKQQAAQDKQQPKVVTKSDSVKIERAQAVVTKNIIV